MKRFKLFLALFFLIFNGFAYAEVLTLSVGHPNAKYGVFSTYDLKVEPLKDNSGRVKLLEELVFIDAHEKKWVAPKGYIVDGATIPEALQQFVGTPYGGEYVLASVIHDVACDKQEEPWEEVHQVFYDAMMASGMEEGRASAMYIAVYEVAPRWGENLEGHLSAEKMDSAIGNVLESLNIKIENSSNGLVVSVGGAEKK